MIVINLSGGLGNQMFQFAFGESVAVGTGQKVLYSIDSLSKNNSNRRFELENAFNLKVPFASSGDIRSILGVWCSSLFVRSVLARLNASSIWGSNLLTEKLFNQLGSINALREGNFYLHGYWQSEFFFKSNEALIRKAFSFHEGASIENQEIAFRIRERPSISMHIRRGDYISNARAMKLHGVLSIEYYLSAIAFLRKRVPNARLFIFSDDPGWVRSEMLDQIKNSECVSINNGIDSFRDMQLMSICDHNIVANSSFSWWSAWLNLNPEKIVIAPQKWFSNESNSNKNLIPPSWERI